VPELEDLEFVELLEEGDLAVDHVPRAFVDVLLLAHEVRDIVLVLCYSHKARLCEHDLAWHCFALISCFFKDQTGITGIRIDFQRNEDLVLVVVDDV